MDGFSRLLRRAAAALFFALALSQAGEARAQWAPSPSNSNNIYSTNTGAVGVGTSSPGNYRLHVFGVGSSWDAMIANFFGAADTQLESQAGVKVGLLNNYYNASSAAEAVRGVVSLGYSNGGAGSQLTGFYSRQRARNSGAVAQGVNVFVDADDGFGSAGQLLIGGRFLAKTTDASGGGSNAAYGVYAAGVVGASAGSNHSSFGVVARAVANAGTGASVTAYGVFADGINQGAGRAYGVYSAGGTNYFNGNVGVGTAAPAAPLHVVGAIRVNYSDAVTWPAIRGEFRHLGDGGGLSILAQGANGSASGSGDINFLTSTSNSADGLTDAPTATRMTIKYNGNVGVGTTSPAHKLDVAGAVNASASGGLCIAGECKTSWSQVGGQWASTGTGISYGAGNVGVGTTTPAARLEVNRGGTSGEAVRAASGAAGNYVYYGIGRTGLEALFGVAAGADQFLTGTAAGDFVINAQSAGQKIFFGAGPAPALVMGSGGVGVGGVPSSAYKLDVNGAARVSGDMTVDGNINAKFQDMAEWVPSTQKLVAGTVVVLDPERANQVVSSTEAYDTRVAGVVSARPGIALGEGGEGKVLVATTGRVRVKVDASRAPVRIGDLLVTSEAPGVAMRSEPISVGGRKMHAPGTIVGKALEPLEKGVGEILVLLSLQ